jgi:hypothetical protein
MVALFLTDTSEAARGWFVRAAGIDVNAWIGESRLSMLVSSVCSSHLSLLSLLPTMIEWRKESPVVPRTALGAKLLAIRRRIEQSGERLLTLDEIRTELSERRREAE